MHRRRLGTGMGKLKFKRFYFFVAQNFGDGACHLSDNGRNGGVAWCEMRDGSHD